MHTYEKVSNNIKYNKSKKNIFSRKIRLKKVVNLGENREMGCIFGKGGKIKRDMDKISERKRKIVMIGLDGAGKTSILN